LFVVIAITITWHQRSLLLPIFIGLSATLKGWLKLLTPKFLVLLFKNSLFLKVKQILIRASTRFAVLSHKPWRHKLRSLKASISRTSLKIIQLYLNSPLWLRTSIALGILFVTASSSYVVIALLIIPQSILTWLKRLILKMLNRSGITHLFSAIWKFAVPANVQHKWYMHRKWTMGRRQVITAQRLRSTILNSNMQPARISSRGSETDNSAHIENHKKSDTRNE